MRLVLIIVIVLITYGSLFPFDFTDPGTVSPDLWHWLLSFEQRTTRGDILGNVLLFIPLGFFGALNIELTDKRSHLWLTLLLVIAGLGFAFILQVLQFYLPSRISASGDAWANLIGLIIGVGIVRLMTSQWLARRYNSNTVTAKIAIPLILATCWFGYHWFPFVPSLDWAQIVFSFRPLTHWHLLSPYFFLDQLLAWSLFWYFCTKLFPSTMNQWHRFGVLLVIMVGQILLIRNLMTLNSLMAAVASILLVGQMGRLSKPVIAITLMGWLMIRGWYPFTLNDATESINLIPFASFLKGAMWINSYVLFENLFFYGAASYFCFRWLGDWIKTAILLALWLLVVEIGQLWFSPNGAELTDPLIVLFLSFGFAHLQHKKTHTNHAIVTSA